MSNVSGVYYDGKTSQPYPARLEKLADGSIQLHCDNTKIVDSVSFEQLKIASRVGNTPRSIYFSDGGKFETKDNEIIDSWLKVGEAAKYSGLAHYLESHWRFVFVGIVVVILSLWITTKYIIPATSEIIAYRLPPSMSQQLGQYTLNTLDEWVFDTSRLDKSKQQELQALFDRYFSDSTYQMKLHFRYSEDVGPNAFALPSGDIVVTDDLVEIAGSDKEILAVMAHEVGHVEQRHILRRIIQDSFFVFIITMVTGDIASVSSGIIAAPAIFIEMAYSREFEREADQFALEFLREHEINPVYFSNIIWRMSNWKRVDEIDKQDEDDGISVSYNNKQIGRIIEGYLSSHPAPEDRIRLFGSPDIAIDEAHE